MVIEKGDKSLEPKGLLAEVTRRPNQLLEIVYRCAPNAPDAEYPALSQILECELNILPTRILGQECADDDLKASTSRPPMQGPIGFRQSAINVRDGGVRRHAFSVADYGR